MRSEQEIFDELAALCASPGYAHAIAYFCYRDHFVGFADELKPEDYPNLFSTERLIRTEISTLIGLMLRGPRDLNLPEPKALEAYVAQTEVLLNELHQALQQPMRAELEAAFADRATTTRVDPFAKAAAMREPIFYGAESAWGSQYRDFAVQRYARDADWLQKNKGFTPEEGKKIIAAINDFLNGSILATLKAMKTLPPERWTVLDGFQFTAAAISAKSGLPSEKVQAVITAFSNPEDGNPTFTSLNAFNASNAYPILKADGEKHLVFLQTGLNEALYDNPFYWMIVDKAYLETAMKNRGLFTEEFVADRLERVFGADKVFRNVDIWDTKARKKKLGEIDTLILIADRALIFQEKSKKLTLEARKGNDLQLQADFKAAVQDAYDQAFECAQHLISGVAVFTDAGGKEISIPRPIKHIHPVCVVSDHYAALSFQARQFLNFTATETIKPPLVCDVFFIDVVTEFLDTPLHCLSYLELRARAANNVMTSHELTALAFHLKQNLWLGEYDLIVLEDDIAIDLDVAMAVRREGIAGQRTPPGILTRRRDTSVGHIIDEIEKQSDAGAIELGLELLKLSSEGVLDVSRSIDKIAAMAAQDGKHHDVTLANSKAGTGITVHCNDLPPPLAAPKLKRHCELRKYSVKAGAWFGLAITPGSAAVRFGLTLDNPWQVDKSMDEAVAKMPKAQPIEAIRTFAKSRATRRKIGRNEPCHCGSGLNADLYISIVRTDEPGRPVSKGLLVQSKWDDALGSIGRLREQSEDMLDRSDESYVWIYERDGVAVVPAKKLRDPRPDFDSDVTAGDLIGAAMECRAGDERLGRDINLPTVESLNQKLEELGVPTALSFQVTRS
jgi:hypothetical protein